MGVGCLWRLGKQRDPFRGAAGDALLFAIVALCYSRSWLLVIFRCLYLPRVFPENAMPDR